MVNEKCRIYLIDIRTLQSDYARFFSLLTPRRKKDVQGFRKEEDRLHSMAAGLLLKCVLKASDDSLRHTPEGKPFVEDSVRFSLSHGGNYAALAVMDSEVGVDVEPIAQMKQDGFRMIAKRVFSPDEIAWMNGADEKKNFFILWTKKESILKADGRGFLLEPCSFSVLSGCKWITEHIEFDNHIIAIASEKPFSIETHVLSVQEVLKDEVCPQVIDCAF